MSHVLPVGHVHLLEPIVDVAPVGQTLHPVPCPSVSLPVALNLFAGHWARIGALDVSRANGFHVRALDPELRMEEAVTFLPLGSSMIIVYPNRLYTVPVGPAAPSELTRLEQLVPAA